MKLLLDENLSDKIIPRISGLFPGSSHVKANGLMHASDIEIWDFAAEGGFTIVSKDADFHQRSLLKGAPPKLIYLRVGNCPTERIVEMLCSNASEINTFEADRDASVLVLR